jgi:predicted nucleotidyltransferase component of viral defense system
VYDDILTVPRASSALDHHPLTSTRMKKRCSETGNVTRIFMAQRDAWPNPWIQILDKYVQILHLSSMAFSARQSVESFHLAFLRALVARGEDKGLFSLKGGCNLRFFFRSVRYSEDIDIDAAVVAKETLRRKVDRLLSAPVVLGPLKSQGIEVVDISAPKQTETTQRWKVGLRIEEPAVTLRTKIEFSRRDELAGTAVEAVDPEILRPYAMTQFLAPHYTVSAAIAQKIAALHGRTQPQARDVFDLNLLFARPDSREFALPEKQKHSLTAAIERAMAISFDEYAAQVVAFLDPDQQMLFEERSAWDAMQGQVIQRLEALQ